MPQWAVDWAKDRFNMDAKSVKFYVMDEQEPDDSVAFANGDSVFVTSDQRNDEEVIKHELTHIYQQAIGTATEGNAGDASLEEEAVQVSRKNESIPDKDQDQSDRYILPREKTNAVQFYRARMNFIQRVGLGIGSILTLGAIPLGMWIYAKRKCKIIARNTGVKLEYVNEIYDLFRFVIRDGLKVRAYLRYVYDLCRIIRARKISMDTIRKDARILRHENYETVWKYSSMLLAGFSGLSDKDGKESIFRFYDKEQRPDSVYFDYGYKNTNINFYQYANFYKVASGLKDVTTYDELRDMIADPKIKAEKPSYSMDQVKEDLKNLFGLRPQDHKSLYVFDKYKEIFEITKGFSFIGSDKIAENYQKYTGELPDAFSGYKILKLLEDTKCFNLALTPEKFHAVKSKLAGILNCDYNGNNKNNKNKSRAFLDFENLTWAVLRKTDLLRGKLSLDEAVDKLLEIVENDERYSFRRRGKSPWTADNIFQLLRDFEDATYKI